MITPMSWVKDYVPDLNCTDQEYCDGMTLSGTKVESYRRLDKNCEKIVVGRVDSMIKHPNADHLWVCLVNIGSAYAANGYTKDNDGIDEQYRQESENCIQICTSAQNLKVGDVVPTCLNGGKVAGGHDGGPMPEEGIKIKSGKMRGLASCGMMCGIEELGASRDMYPEAPENGIYVFPREMAKDLPLGSDAVEALGLHDTNVEYEVTSNRVDCYSILGIAREAAVTFKKPFVPPETPLKRENSKNTSDYISVEVIDKDLCTRYIGAICTDVKIGPSPWWMQRRLANYGIRPINNLVDITNFVMMEYGQPMHAYDYDTIKGHKIIVRRAHDGDTFVTLDGQERTLDHDVIMINDAERAVGIGGIMGGEDSMITDDVKTVFFEAATFNGTNIRKSAKRIGMRTEASALFEKGLDPYNAMAAMERACQLMEELGCGKVAKTFIDVHDELPALTRIPFEMDKINAYLGTKYSRETMLDIFAREGLEYDEEKNEFVIPSFRQDLKGMCDLSEEVARFDGYDKIPSTLPRSTATEYGLKPLMKLQDIARETAVECGYSEANTFSFESPKEFDKLRLPQDAAERNAIRISNPLGEDYSIMRTQMVSSMLKSLGTNYAYRNKDVKLFDMGKIYLSNQLPITDYPDERSMFTLGFYGKGDFYTLKGTVDMFLRTCGVQKKFVCSPEISKPFLHPGRQAAIILSDPHKGKKKDAVDVTIGYMGEIHPLVSHAYGIEERVYFAVLDLRSVLNESHFIHHYDGIARFPAITRDISMVVPKPILAADIDAVIEQHGGKILESYRLFDVYEGVQVKIGCKSMAYSLTFRCKDRTLETEEVDKVMKKIVLGLQEMGIELRS